MLYAGFFTESKMKILAENLHSNGIKMAHTEKINHALINAEEKAEDLDFLMRTFSQKGRWTTSK